MIWYSWIVKKMFYIIYILKYWKIKFKFYDVGEF